MRVTSLQTVGLCFVISAALSGCLQATDDLAQSAKSVSPSVETATASADPVTGQSVGQPYAKVLAAAHANQGDGTTEPALGPMIGATVLASGAMVYRHLAPADTTSASTGYAEPNGKPLPYERERLVYFLVGPDGVVRDWASGYTPGGTGNCFGGLKGASSGGYACAQADLKQAVVAMFDAAVKTRSGQPIGVWGPTERPAMDNGTN
ncbi:hypothetical protein ACQQ2Q_02490 [Agrobacterium sp. ES01]|uniref:hypothetical protein n=1 Tax=Agrobacterium sp. ES01 TaxID=3420714 RepID=UPI003D13AF9E